jgi:hypothetical protein
VTNLFIANLAFSDVIIAVFCIPFQASFGLLRHFPLRLKGSVEPPFKKLTSGVDVIFDLFVSPVALT